MVDFNKILDKSVTGVLASVDENNSPDTRLFQSLWCENDKVFFCTGAYKEICEQLKHNHNISFCVENNNNPVLTLNGEAIFVDDLKVKEKAFEKIPRLKDRYGCVENDDFKVFYLKIKMIKTFTYEEGTKVYNL